MTFAHAKRRRAGIARPHIPLGARPTSSRNRARVRQILGPEVMQTKLTVGAPDDGEAVAAAPLLASRPMLDGAPTAYVCSGFACREPVTTPEALRQQLGG